jgi:DNA-binding NtrC family response regulator
MEDFSRTIRNDTIKPILYSNVVFSFNKLFSNRSEIFTLQEKLDKIESDKENGPAGGEKKEDTQTLLSKQIEIIKKALANSGGNRKNAARELGMTEKLFTQILKEYKL